MLDNFKLYATLHEQKFRREENTMIVLQSFIHFLKAMDFCKSKDDVAQATECMHEIDGVTIPFQDTLNLLNGLNYA